ncbi:MAG: hypothetical protein OXR72_03255 [Gemmatimonadota bacterium]|nr:hypothetical protein [Gemmatimonadota bacterium]
MREFAIYLAFNLFFRRVGKGVRQLNGGVNRGLLGREYSLGVTLSAGGSDNRPAAGQRQDGARRQNRHEGRAPGLWPPLQAFTPGLTAARHNSRTLLVHTDGAAGQRRVSTEVFLKNSRLWLPLRE